MSIGSGMSGSFGWSKESTYGTRVAPAKFIRHRGAEFNFEPNRVQGEGIQSGAYGLRYDQFVETHKQASASVEFDVVTLNMLQLLENLMGGTPASSNLSGTAYSHTFTLGDNLGKMLTLQQNVALRTGTDKAKEIVGAKATSATFSCGVGEMLTCQMEFTGANYDTGQSLAAPSYVSGVPFHFGQSGIGVGTYLSETSLTGVRAWSMTINRPMDTETFVYGQTIKNQPVLNAPTEITGTIESDYTAVADFEDRFSTLPSTAPALVVNFTGANITGIYNYLFRVRLPSISIEGPSQNNAGYDVPRNQWSYTWRYDGTNLPQIVVYSTETSV
jgi:hypothetical protein